MSFPTRSQTPSCITLSGNVCNSDLFIYLNWIAAVRWKQHISLTSWHHFQCSKSRQSIPALLSSMVCPCSFCFVEIQFKPLSILQTIQLLDTPLSLYTGRLGRPIAEGDSHNLRFLREGLFYHQSPVRGLLCLWCQCLIGLFSSWTAGKIIGSLLKCQWSLWNNLAGV